MQDKRAINLRGDNDIVVRAEVKVGEAVLWGRTVDHRGVGMLKEDLKANQLLHCMGTARTWPTCG